MDHNTPHDKSGSYNNRIEAHIARLEDLNTRLLEDICIDELSAYQRVQLTLKYYGLLLRLLRLQQKVEAESHNNLSLADKLRAVLDPPPGLPDTTWSDRP